MPAQLGHDSAVGREARDTAAHWLFRDQDLGMHAHALEQWGGAPNSGLLPIELVPIGYCRGFASPIASLVEYLTSHVPGRRD